MSFFRHREIYRSDVGWEPAAATLSRRCRAHRPDESPAGYSLAGCSPAEPASASPAKLILQCQRPCANGITANGNLSLSRLSQERGSVYGSATLKPGNRKPGTVHAIADSIDSRTIRGRRGAGAGLVPDGESCSSGCSCGAQRLLFGAPAAGPRAGMRCPGASGHSAELHTAGTPFTPSRNNLAQAPQALAHIAPVRRLTAPLK